MTAVAGMDLPLSSIVSSIRMEAPVLECTRPEDIHIEAEVIGRALPCCHLVVCKSSTTLSFHDISGGVHGISKRANVDVNIIINDQDMRQPDETTAAKVCHVNGEDGLGRFQRLVMTDYSTLIIPQ